MARVLVIGQNGQVSTYLQRVLPRVAKLVVAGRDQLDLAKPELVGAALDQFEVDIVINPAAYTAVDLAEQESELAYAINRDSAGEIAKWCAAKGIPLIHYSTDYVFDGDSDKPYVETDTPAPTGVYGASKLAGEQAILDSGASALILRTSWVYSNHGKNFYKTMLGLAESRNELSVVADQIGSPTYAGSIAQATTEIVEQLLAGKELNSGVYHFTCQGQTSWHGFAQGLFGANGITSMQVNPIPTSEYPTPAKRPAYSVLSTQKLQDEFGVSLPLWPQALEDCVQETNS